MINKMRRGSSPRANTAICILCPYIWRSFKWRLAFYYRVDRFAPSSRCDHRVAKGKGGEKNRKGRQQSTLPLSLLSTFYQHGLTRRHTIRVINEGILENRRRTILHRAHGIIEYVSLAKFNRYFLVNYFTLENRWVTINCVQVLGWIESIDTNMEDL